MAEPGEMHKGYFEGVLQLRNPSKEIIEFVEKAIKENHIHIAGRMKVGNGSDIKMSSNRFMIKLGKQLKEKFKGELKISKRLFAGDRQTSKMVWRITVLFSHYGLKVGQCVRCRGENFKINRIADKVHCVSLETGKKKLFEFKDIQN